MSIKTDSKLLLIAPYFVIALVLLAVYAPVVTERYAWMDDYISAIWAHEGPFSLQTKHPVGHGRPLHALWVHWGFRTVAEIDDLWRLRALGLAMVALLCCMIYKTLRDENMHPLGALSCALLVGFTPGAAIHAGWAQIFSYPMACALALAGGLLILPKHGLSILQIWMRRGSSALMLLIAFTIFQPGAGFYLLPAFARIWRKDLLQRERVIAFTLACCAFVVTSIFYLAVYKLSVLTIIANNPGVGRGAISLDLVNKATFALTQLAPNSFLFWTILHEQAIVFRIFVSAFMTSGIALAFYFRRNERILLLLACLITASFTLSAILLPKELNATFRTIIQFQAILIFVAVLGWINLTQHLRSKLQGTLSAVVMVLFVLCCGLGIRWALVETFIRPQQFELQMLTEHIQENFTYMPERIVFVRPLWYIPSITDGIVQEFGLTTTWVDFMPRKVLSIIFREVLPEDFANKGLLYLNVDIVAEPEDAQDGTLPIIDARGLLWP